MYKHTLCHACYYMDVAAIRATGRRTVFPRLTHACRECIHESVWTKKPFCDECEKNLAGQVCVYCEQVLEEWTNLPEHSPFVEARK